METLIEGLLKEINRNRELLYEYEKIPAGTFGAICIKDSINRAEKAIVEDDVVKMLSSYKELQDTC